ncbi:MAG: hypothetical protein HY238_06420 [Acidobacteria bacterium]|nr:hypothetical protein [Acidobacteriota bacterium]
MPALLRIRRYRFFFLSTYAKFWLEPVTVGDLRGFRGHEMTEIRQIAVEKQQFFRAARG